MSNLIIQDLSDIAPYVDDKAGISSTPSAGPSAPVGGSTGDRVTGFVQEYLPVAQKVAARTGVEPHVLLGQWGLETGWGKSVIPGTRNLGNIKQGSSWKGRTVDATDNATGSRDPYRAYDDDDGFANDFADLLERRYRNALNYGDNAAGYFNALKSGGYAEDPGYVNKGISAARMARSAIGSVASAPTGSTVNPDDYARRGAAPQDPGVVGDIKDSALALGAGVVRGAGMLAGAFGADNDLAQGASDLADGLMDKQSEARKAQRANRAEIIRQAEESGSTWEEIKANIGAFAEAPIETSLGAIGTSAPTILMSLIPGLGQATAARLILQGAVSAAQGAGSVKGSIYEAVERKMIESGHDADTAAKVAAGAQAYDGVNGGQIALGAALGVAAGTTGIERSVAGMMGAAAPGKKLGVLSRALLGAAKEAPTEGAQGGQERFAANQALINQGFDVDPWAGVAGQAAGEAVAAAGPGGVFGALDTSKPAAPAPAPAAAPGQTPGPAAQQSPAGTPPGGAGAAPTQPAASVDKVGARASEIEQQVRAEGLLEKLRSIGQPGRTAGEFLDALAVAKNPNIDPSVRQQAIESLEMALGWIRDGAMPNDPATGKPFSTELSVQPVPREPGTDLAPRDDAPVAPAGMGQFFDPNVVDVDAVRVDNMIGGPRAIDPPRARLAAPDDAELDVGVEQTPVADDQPAADAAVEAPAPAGLDGRVGAPSGAETAARRLVDLPKVAVPAGAEPAVQRREAAQIKAAVEAGFDTVERRDDGVYLVHSGRNQESKLSGLGAMVRARKIIADTMAARANEAASSPLNDLEQPTEAQAKAGNYRKGAARLNGFAISIENPRDSVRSGTSPDGKKWESRMAHHYGYIKGSVGADGDQVDVFIGPRPDLDTVFVVDQVDPATGEFDEHKVMMGFKSLEDARAGYLANYEPGWKGMASITEMPLSTFRKWVRSPAARLPASQYDPRSSNGEQDGQQSDDRAGGPGLGEELRRQDGVGQGLGEVDGEGGGEARQRQDAAVSGGSGRAAAQQGDRDPRPAGRDQASDAVAIEALAAAVERDGRQVKIETVDPSDPRAQAASDLFNAFERLTGHRVIPVVVTGPDAFDGVQLGENTFVNIDGLEQSLAWTVGHEFKHLSDRLPGLAKLYDRIWDLIPTSARAKYLPYLHQTRQVSTNQLSLATPADLAKLKDEMVADFMGQRFNDKAWLQQLAQQKPALFGNFVRDWVKVLNSLIGELQVLLGIRGGRGAAGKDIDAMLSGYIEQLEEAKAIAIEVAAVWAERNPKLAQAAGIGARADDPKFSAREEFPSLDPDFLDGELEAMLQEELEAELAGGNGEVGMPDEASIKAAGLMAEDAFPALYWQDEDREGIRETVRIPDLYREGKTAVIDVEQMGQDGLWGAQMQTTWVGPGAGEREGYVSIDDAKDFVHRQVAAVMLHRSGYDLLQAAPKAPVRRVVAGWREIGEIRDDGLRSVRHYRRPTSKTASLKDLAAEMGLDKDYDVVVNVDTPLPGETIYNIGFNSKTSDKRYGALLTIISNGSKKHMSVNTIELARSGMGGAVYQLVSEFAARRGIPLMPESSISGVNAYRRTEQMISAALRTGKSNVMVPHETQRVYGFNDGASTQEQHDDNMGRLILASLRNAVELAPEVMDLRYHPHTGVFTMEDGSDAERLVAEILSRTETRAFGLGRAQLARAAMTREMMSGKLKAEKIESFASPVLYSARETAAAEYQAVVDQHMGKATWMKAPNGQPTKLTERQWVQVRTPSFKRWFGDWEAFALRDGGVWSDGEGAVSKAVHPETGEPLVIYHGTDKGGFFEFNTPSGERRGNLGIFTTDDYDMARSYVRRGRVQDFTPPTSQDELEEAGFQFEQGYILAGNDIGFFESREDLLEEYELDPGEEIVEAWKVIDVDGYALDGLREHQFLFPSKESAIAAAAESFSGTDSVAMVYAGFINLRSPHESYFEGALFNGSRDHQWVVEVGGEIQSDSDGKQYFSDKDEAAEFAKMFVAEDDDGADPYDYVRAADEHHETTDGVVRVARSIGADGAIIRQVIDDGGGPGGYAMDPRDVFVALKPGQIKSAEWNTGEFGDVDDLRYSKRVQDPADGDRTDVSKLPAGKPVPASLAVGSLEQALQVARSGKYAKGRDLKVDLQRRVLEASSAAGIDLTERTKETHKFLAGMVRRDAEFALKDNQNAVGWYDSKVSRALGALATLHPEIDSEPKARLAFLWALATTSNGLKVNKNFELAEAAYQGWKSTGRMPDNIGIGNAAQQINRGLAAFNSLSDKLGAERLAKFMSTEFGAGEIERMLGVPVGGEWKSTPVRGAAILGPKIGNGFFSNLNGYFGALTMDRWLMRTWGRMTGTLIEVDQKMVKASRTRLADRIAAMDDAQRRLMTQLVRAPIKRRMTIAELDAAAGSTAVATMKVNIREQMMANPKTDEFRRAALNHQVQIDGQKEIPAGPGERNWIRAVFHKALGDLNEAGISMTMSDLQALLWYPERRLYDTAKAADEVDQGYSDDEAPDYANAAMALALANGVDLKDVMAAMDRAEKRGTVRGEQLTEAERAAMLKEFRSAPKQPVQMAFEVAPDPADNAATDAWGQLTTKERTQITSSVRDDVLSDIAALVGVPLQKVAPATGGYMGLVNPSLIAEYQKTKVSLEQARALASAIGYVLDQDSVALMDPRVESKAGLIRITFSGKVEPHAHAIYEAIHAAVPEVDAFTARGNNFDILNFTGMSNEDLNDLVVDALAAIDIPLEGVASFGDVHSELVEKGSYENHLQGARPGSGSEIRTGVDWLRDRARKAVKDGIRQALDARRSRLAAAARLDVGAEGPGAAGGARQRGSGAAGNQGGRGNPRLSARGALAAPEPADAQEGLSQRLAPLPGAPNVAGFHGPDPRLVDVAEAYARSIGIALRRQSEYVQVDEDRARRIAQAYEAMEHAPQDPAVKEAYQNLIRQTRAQYDALVASGYRFWFTDLSVPSNVEYLSTPWNAMRDIRANQAMGVFPTEEGFGSSEEFDPANNPLLEDTGLTWPNGGLDGAPKRVLANDLFRAVHDAFGHGLEGAGFRAQGEENAWQAHARLFTGSALGAITSETRGQNSWLNYGPHGESNRAAKVEETVFADQKTGLMPSWTWTEGRSGDMQDRSMTLERLIGGIPSEDVTRSRIAADIADTMDVVMAMSDAEHGALDALLDALDEAEGGPGSQAYRALADKIGMELDSASEDGTLAEFVGRDGVGAMGLLAELQSARGASLSARTDTPDFKAWFGDSKVVDDQGRPLVVYHGTMSDFSIFQSPADRGGEALAQAGMYFSEDSDLASAYSALRGGGAIMPAYLSIRRPLDLTSASTISGWKGAIAKLIAPRMAADVMREEALRNSTHQSLITKAEREKYRRRGIATAMYSAIEQATGKRLEPAVSLSDDAFELWKSFRPEAVAGDLRHIKDRLVGRKVVKRGLAGKIKDASGRGATMVYDDHPQGPGTTSVLVGRDEINAALEAAGEAPVVPDGMAVRFSIRNGTSAWDAPEPSRFDDFVYKAQDKLIDLKRVIQSIKAATGAIADDINAYLGEELFHGRAAKRVQDFGTQELTPLMERLAADGLTIGDVEEFLHARHAKEANRVIAQRNPGVPELQDGGSGMEDAEADAYFANLPAAQRTKLEAAAAMVDAINDRTRQLYVSYGLESQETVDAWKGMFKHYVPLQREDKDGNGGMGIGQGFSVKGKETKGRTGSKRKVVDILANIAMQRERLIVRGEKNRVAKALIGLARANPNPDFWEVRSQAPTERVYDAKSGKVVDRPDPMFKQRPNVLVAKVHDSKGNVVEQAIVFNEDDARGMRLAQAMKNLDAGNLEGVLGISAKITRYFSAVNTQYNPVFGVVNLVRDVQGAMLNLGDTPLAGKRTRIARDTLSALRGIYGDLRAERRGGQASSQWAKLWEEFQEAGGKTGYRELFRTSKDRAEALQEILTPDAWADGKLGKIFTANGTLKVPMSQAKKGADWIFSWLSDYNEAMENGVRLAAYKAALDQGMSQRQAASLAKNLTVNFNRRGQVGMQAGAVYAFFNAAMQGSARIGQTLFDMDGGNLKTLRLSRTGKQVIYGGVLLGSLQALMLAAAGFDDEDPPEFARERSLIIPIGDKKYISIPMPLGFHVIPGVGRHLTEFALGGFSKPAHRLVSMTGMFADAFNPIGNAGLSMQTIAPTALDPLVALTENRDWTGKPISRTSMNPATPGHALHKDTASTIAKLASEAINTATGGNEYVAGVMSPTPDQIDYLIGQVTGGVGRELSKLEQTALGAIRGETVPTFKVPLVGRFVGDAASQASEGTAFYANVAKLNELETEIKGLQGDGRVAEAQQLRAGRPDAYLIAVANTAERQVQRLRREKRALIEEGAPRERVKEVEARITQAMARLNRAAEAVKP